MLFSKIPVGGRLSHFLPEWEKITTDKWILSIIKEGYQLEFIQKPPFLGIKQTLVNAKNLEILDLEIKSLLEENAIEQVPKNQIQCGFYSTLFLVPKKNGEMRPVINLRPLNKYLRKQHFKMDTMSKVLNLVKKGDWAVTLDLKDAYLHVPIFQKHRKYLRFCVRGKVYQFKALCFGPTSAPRIFTKIISVIAAHLRKQSIRLATYLDDWLAVNQMKNMLLKNREVILNLLIRLGFIINKQKSNLIPTQDITYIGGRFRLDLGKVYPTQERMKHLKLEIHKLLKGQNSARQYLVILGIIASCLELIPNSRLFMRPIQIHLLQQWSPSKMGLDYIVQCTADLKAHLSWWLCSVNTMKGRSLAPFKTSATITTDASLMGWGGHMNNQTIQGLWPDKMKTQHINNLELEAVFLTVKHFLPQLRNKSVLVRSDNTTVVQYINKQGGTRSVLLCQETWKLWNLALENNMILIAAHIAGVSNTLADQLSRFKIKSTEWSLNPLVTQQIFNMWGMPLIDLFASAQNRKAPVYCSWTKDPAAFAMDALSISWENMFAFAYPPLSLIPKVLQHMQQCQCELILIAPFWSRQTWYPQLLQLLIAPPVKLPLLKNLLTQGKTNIPHPNPEVFQLTAWRLSTKVLKQKAFQKTLESCSLSHGDLEHKRITKASSENFTAGVLNGKLIPLMQI